MQIFKLGYLSLILSSLQMQSICINADSRNSSSAYPMETLELTVLLDHNYYFSDFKLTWIDAMTFCKLYEMELVKVESMEENIAIKNKLATMQLPSDFSYGFYTSGHRMGKSSTSDYRWADGSAITWVIQEWCPGTPDNVAGREDCLEYSLDFCWNDISCAPYTVSSTSYVPEHGRNFICEEM